MAMSMYFINDGKAFYKIEYHHEPCITCATEAIEHTSAILLELKDADLNSFCIIDDIIAYDSEGLFISGKREKETEKPYDIFKADKRTLQSLGGRTLLYGPDPVNNERYYKDKNNVYYDFMIMDNVDIETFNMQNNTFWSDKNHVYAKGKPLKNSDGSKPCRRLTTEGQEFVYPGNKHPYYHYIENNNNIYIHSQHLDTKQIEKADPETFVVLGHGYSAYSKDKNNVYFTDRIIKKADPQTFEIIQVGYKEYAKDKKHIYYQGEVLEGFSQISGSKYITDGKNIYLLPYRTKVLNADVASFEPVDDVYAKDRNNLYYNAYPVKGFDTSTFIYLYPGIVADKNNVYKSGNIDSKIDASTLQKINDKYFKDKNHVYFGYYIVEKADPETFRPIDELYAVDKNYLYLGIKVLYRLAHNNPDSVRYEGDFLVIDEKRVFHKGKNTQVDPKSHKALNQYYSEDKNGIYYYYSFSFRPVTGADKESFEILSSRYARDKKNVYYEGIKIHNVHRHSFQVLCDTIQFNRMYKPYDQFQISIANDKYVTCLYARPQEDIKINAETFKIHDFDFEDGSTLISDHSHACNVSRYFITPTDIDIHTFTKYHSVYYKDKNHVYLNASKKLDADRDSFRKGRTLNYKQYYVDKNHVYLDGAIQEHLKVEDYTMD